VQLLKGYLGYIRKDEALMCDLLIRNALIYDGTGAPAFRGCVAVKGGKIQYVGHEYDGPAREILDAEGLCVAPGFIDSHSHADYAVFTDPHRDHVLRMGVTTEVAGQCGYSVSPIPADTPAATADFVRQRNAPLFPTMREQIENMQRLEMGTNIRCFAGHGLLRAGAIGLGDTKATDDQIRSMQDALRMAIYQGAAGLSTGLSYAPGIYSNVHELIALARVAGEAGGMYTTHSRSESMGLFKSVDECIRIAREADVPVNISHFKVVGKIFWDHCAKALEMIDEALEEGLDITLDCYPYTAVSTTPLSTVPPQFLTEGGEMLAQRLENPIVADEIRRYIFEVNDPGWDNSMFYVGLENFRIVVADATPWAVGKSYVEIAREMGMDPFETWVYLLRLNRCNMTECRFAMCEENVEMILKHSKCMVGSDGIYMKGDPSAHPRAFGTFPRYLGRYIRGRKILSREEGIHRITGMPARRYGLTGKGVIEPGFDADIVIFDYDSILDHADFCNPFKRNEGIHRVYMNGRLVMKDDETTGVYTGRIL